MRQIENSKIADLNTTNNYVKHKWTKYSNQKAEIVMVD